VARTGKSNNSNGIFVGSPSEKHPLGRLRRCMDYIRMCLTEVSCEAGKWMELAQDHVQWWVLILSMLNLQVLLPYCLFVC
jgi:hypothetical protein